MNVEVLQHSSTIAGIREEWDDLAVACGRPYAAPSWGLSWWEHVARPGCELRVVTVRDGGALVGLAAVAVERRRGGFTRLLPAGGTLGPRVEPLARPEHRRPVAEALVRGLAEMDPAPDMLVLADVDECSPWPRLLADVWPGLPRAGVLLRRSGPSPTISLTGRTYDEWLASRSSNFRSQIRRGMRRLEADGLTFRLSTPDRLAGDLEAFERLHHSRWDDRGGSAVLDDRVERMVAATVRELAGKDRAELWCLDDGDRVVATQLILIAGGEAGYWLGGFDAEYGDRKPGLLTLVRALQSAFDRGLDRMDLGLGNQGYKYRMADGEEQLAHAFVFLPGARGTAERLRYAPLALRQFARENLPPDVKTRIRERLPERLREGFGQPAP